MHGQQSIKKSSLHCLIVNVKTI